MFTASILKGIQDPELRKALHLDEGENTESTMNWIRDKPIEKHADKNAPPDDVQDDSKPLQQSDLLRAFYLSIAYVDLRWTYYNPFILKPDDLPKPKESDFHISGVPFVEYNTVDKSHKPVIIVGAGMSGLVAGYELKRVGYDVNILEMSERFGGRVKTLGQKEGFDRGLHTDAGAMRLPLPPDPNRPISKTLHYLTDFYAEKKFKIKPVPFSNASEKAFYNFYGNITKISEWDDCQFSEYWPGWNAKLIKSGLDKKITSIDAYYEHTTNFVIDLLRNRLRDIPWWNVKAKADQWNIWTKNWCQFSFEAFLRSTVEGIKSQLDKKYLTPGEAIKLEGLKKFLPWPDEAFTAYTVFNYTLSLDVSLVSQLQEDMAHWWTNDMHSLEGGLSALPTAFATGAGNMEENITYNRTVTKVEYFWTSNSEKFVRVSGVFTSSGETFSVEGRSVILTPPLHVIRGIQIVNGIAIPDGISAASIKDDCILKRFPMDFQKAIQDISYSPSTKIMLQYRKQFWNPGNGPETDITGGFSKTNMPIGQLHYPTEVTVTEKEGVNGGTFIDIQPIPTTADQKGILMVYTWKSEALLWGALKEDMAISLAVNQIDELHPEIDTKELFEVGYRQAWAMDPTTLGAFAMLRPREYASVIYLMQHSWRNVYFAGEAISFANGWIQGALESGLRAAYQLFSDDQEKKKPKPKPC